jgi:hypothetical protein
VPAVELLAQQALRRIIMDANKRVDLLKDEYVMLQHFYEDIDQKGLNIKNWSITVALASVGAGFIYHRDIFLLGFGTAVMFWILEAYWRGLSYFFVVRIKDIESVFANKEEAQEIPLQIYATWERAFEKRGDQTLRYMFKFSSMLPHVAIALVNLLLYFFGDSLPPIP